MNSRRILDTNRLCRFWNRQRAKRRRLDRKLVRGWAAEMIELEGTNAIVTPVRIEFLCGAQSSSELVLYEAFLEAFVVIDEGRILQEDWKEATRIARRVPASGKRRQLGDCLIAAVARRLNWEVMTDEIGFPK